DDLGPRVESRPVVLVESHRDADADQSQVVDEDIEDPGGSDQARRLTDEDSLESDLLGNTRSPGCGHGCSPPQFRTEPTGAGSNPLSGGDDGSQVGAQVPMPLPRRIGGCDDAM